MSHSRTKLERRAGLLLLAYPAGYRRDRAEEMIGTLLEATPPGRSFPSARDAWSLIAGGRRARATRNRAPSAKENLRLTLRLGLSIFLSASIDLLAIPRGDLWSMIAVVALGTVLVLAPWLNSRIATAALILPTGAVAAYRLTVPVPMLHAWQAYLAGLLIAMVALAALSGGSPQPPRSWIWLPCVAPTALMVTAHDSYFVAAQWLDYTRFLLLVVVACWLVTDARPAFAFCVAELLTVLIAIVPDLAVSGMHPAMLMTLLLQFTIILPVLLPASWLFWRQTVGGTSPAMRNR